MCVCVCVVCVFALAFDAGRNHAFAQAYTHIHTYTHTYHTWYTYISYMVHRVLPLPSRTPSKAKTGLPKSGPKQSGIPNPDRQQSGPAGTLTQARC